VWAETAIPAYLLQDRRLLAWVRAVADTNDVFLYTGYPEATLGPDNRQERTNGSGLFAPDGQLIGRYAKHHLLPFGERMPFSALVPAISRVDFGQAEWTPGALPTPMVLTTPGGEYRLAGLICFESIFPGLSRVAVRRGAELLVNITNDGWFGVTAGPRQHAELARLRAAECGVPLVRCANNGISFVTDAIDVTSSAAFAKTGLPSPASSTMALADMRRSLDASSATGWALAVAAPNAAKTTINTRFIV